MTDQTIPSTATAARTQLDAKLADRDWGARVLNGDPTANKELRELSAKSADGGNDVVEAVIKGTIPELKLRGDERMMVAGLGMFRDLGLDDGVAKQFLSQHQVSREEFVRVENWKKQAMGSKDFVDKLLAGDSEAKAKMLTANSVIVNGWKDEA